MASNGGDCSVNWLRDMVARLLGRSVAQTPNSVRRADRLLTGDHAALRRFEVIVKVKRPQNGHGR